MQKQFFLLTSFALICLGLFSNPVSAQSYICEYSGKSEMKTIKLSAPAKIAVQRIDEILGVIGLSRNFNVMAANIDNAAALVQGSNRYILFNPLFMQTVYDRAGTGWTSYSILAHEIGHHLNGHTIGHHGSAHKSELEADEFSGFILGKLGASLADAQMAMVLISSNTASKTHPAKAIRLNAIAKGWERGYDIR